jgi:hypothetical protein
MDCRAQGWVTQPEHGFVFFSTDPKNDVDDVKAQKFATMMRTAMRTCAKGGMSNARAGDDRRVFRSNVGDLMFVVGRQPTRGQLNDAMERCDLSNADVI